MTRNSQFRRNVGLLGVACAVSPGAASASNFEGAGVLLVFVLLLIFGPPIVIACLSPAKYAVVAFVISTTALLGGQAAVHYLGGEWIAAMIVYAITLLVCGAYALDERAKMIQKAKEEAPARPDA
ncbi:hypothetical protein [Aquimonas voraii]|uniref:Uncharacterized protein n=1 Tax=Aquimonas voraii TaxID=265719 RepID=A0A1G6RVN0_9GAMM|nr:hypothetical protein [Aquimonas voraii]SDD08017.1 hypothetical protein SAMN04488509_10196 [Aquimonas voraii]